MTLREFVISQKSNVNSIFNTTKGLYIDIRVWENEDISDYLDWSGVCDAMHNSTNDWSEYLDYKVGYVEFLEFCDCFDLSNCLVVDIEPVSESGVK